MQFCYTGAICQPNASNTPVLKLAFKMKAFVENWTFWSSLSFTLKLQFKP